MPRVGKYPSGIRQRSKGNWEYRHSWSAVEIDRLYRKYGHLLPDQPPNFWKSGQWVEAYASSERDIRSAREHIRAGITLGTYVPRKIDLALTEADAAKEEAKAEAEAVLFSHVAEEYFDFLYRHDIGHGTVRTYRSHFRQGMRPLHDFPVVQITPDDLEEWLEALRENKGQDYAYRVYGTLKQIFKYATGKDPRQHRNFVPYVETDPCVLYAGKKPESKKQQVLTLDQVKALAEGMPPHRSIFVWLGALGGLRQGEALGLQRKHVTIEDGHVWVTIEQQLKRAKEGAAFLGPPKSSAGFRRIPLMRWDDIDPVPLFEQCLAEHVGESPEAHIVPVKSGYPGWVSHSQNAKDFRIAREPLGRALKGVTSHALRHTALTKFGRLGATTADLMNYGGHADPKAVAIYQHSNAQSLARLIGGAQ